MCTEARMCALYCCLKRGVEPLCVPKVAAHVAGRPSCTIVRARYRCTDMCPLEPSHREGTIRGGESAFGVRVAGK
eukprot:1303953-Alexandrium_andersonii.AAC.1